MAHAVEIRPESPVEVRDLAAMSARIGRDPLLAQASSGNTSVKIGDIVWIKASGRCLRHALDDEDTFVPVLLADVRQSFDSNQEFKGECMVADGRKASIETATHAVVPQRVVIHVHSVNAISWAVRRDGPERLAERLSGLDWHWIPYVTSGLPLARSIKRALATSPYACVFILANHGLVVCGEDCQSAEALLTEVERRLASVVRSTEPGEATRRILEGGILYPCQAIFLGTQPPVLDSESAGISVAQRAVLDGLIEVARRIEESAPIRYLSPEEVAQLLTEDAHGYRQLSERHAARGTGSRTESC
jgi:ribulose-5-phosphate 4-epimerase/fuculose-1-phosphate aldolase